MLLEQSQKDGREKDAEILRLRGVIGAQESTIEEFNVKFREHETVRRQLHNTIQELKVKLFQLTANTLETIKFSDKLTLANNQDLDQTRGCAMFAILSASLKSLLFISIIVSSNIQE